jgi:hypothetical protein
MENLITTQVEAFKAVFRLGKFDNAQGARVFIPFALLLAVTIIAWGHMSKY